MGSQLESDTTKLLYNLGKDTSWEQATLQTFLKHVNYGSMTVTDHNKHSAGTTWFGSYWLRDNIQEG